MSLDQMSTIQNLLFSALLFQDDVPLPIKMHEAAHKNILAGIWFFEISP